MAEWTQTEIDTAYHEAAHAIAYLEMGYELEFVSIMPPQEGKFGGAKGTIAPEELESKLRQRLDLTPAEVHVLRDEMTNYLMGELAEARLHSETYRLDPHNVRTDDERQVMGRVGAIWTNYDIADVQLETMHVRAEAVVALRWQQIEQLANELLKRKTLTGADVEAAI